MTFWDFATANPLCGTLISITALLVIRSLGRRAHAIVLLCVARRATGSSEVAPAPKRDNDNA